MKIFRFINAVLFLSMALSLQACDNQDKLYTVVVPSSYGTDRYEHCKRDTGGQTWDVFIMPDGRKLVASGTYYYIEEGQ